MGASLSFAALATDKSSANIQSYQEDVAQKSRLYPDSELYDLLEFNYTINEANRTAAKERYKLYLESNGKYQAAIDEAVSGGAVALIAAFIAAAIALIVKLVKGTKETPSPRKRAEAYEDFIKDMPDNAFLDIPKDAKGYSDHINGSIPDMSKCNIAASDTSLRLRELNVRTMCNMFKLKGYADTKKELEEAYKKHEETMCKQVFGDPNSRKFKVINFESEGTAGEIYNKYFAGSRVKQVFLIDNNNSIGKELEEIKKTLQQDNAALGKDLWAGNSADADKIASLYKEIMGKYLNLYQMIYKAVNNGVVAYSNAAIRLAKKFGRMPSTMDGKFAKLKLVEAAVVDASNGYSVDLQKVEDDVEPYNSEEVAAAQAGHPNDDAGFDPVKESYDDKEFGGLFSVEEEVTEYPSDMKVLESVYDPYSYTDTFIESEMVRYQTEYTAMNEGVVAFAIIAAVIAAILAIIRKILKCDSGSPPSSSSSYTYHKSNSGTISRTPNTAVSRVYSAPLPSRPVGQVAPHIIDHSSLTAKTSSTAEKKREENEKRRNNYKKNLDELERRYGEAKKAYEDEKKKSITVPIVTKVNGRSTSVSVNHFRGAVDAADPEKITKYVKDIIMNNEVWKLNAYKPDDYNSPLRKLMKDLDEMTNDIEYKLKMALGIDVNNGVDQELFKIENVTGSQDELESLVRRNHGSAGTRSKDLKELKKCVEDYENRVKKAESEAKVAVEVFSKSYRAYDQEKEAIKEFETNVSKALYLVSTMFLKLERQVEKAYDAMDNADSILAAHADAIKIKATAGTDAHAKKLKYMMSYWDDKDDKDYVEQAGVYSETSFIHGEPFDGDTLYDEEDYQDFNRTDWVNLGLGEHYKDLENQGRIEEAAFKQECLYRAQPDFSVEKLRQLNEGVFEAAKNAMSKAIESLKELVKKFVEKLYAGFGSNKPYLDRYKDIWINKANPGGPFSSTGDIFVAMERIMRVPVPMLNYTQQAGALTDAATFFNTHCKKAFTDNFNGAQFSNLRRRADLNDWKGGDGGMSIADYCKQYFGYGNDNYKNQWNWSDLNSKNMQAIFDWLYDIKKIRDSIQKDQRNIEDSCQRIINEVKKSEQQNKVGNDTAQVNSKAESAAYSYVYQTYVTEMDTAGGTAPAGTAAANKGGNANNNTPTNTSGTGYNDTATAMNDINKNGPANPEEVRKAMNVYLDVVRTILTAKMTGLEFVRKELFALIRYKVNFYVGGNANQATAQPKQNNGGSQNAAPAQGGQTKPAGGPR
ncbi:hypothetical protein [uncultured Duncaniella sp.]|uniref:hypothetical protein n=1 Tax=uncultured Duncaniella sp. TaxID=2768039 RepID=UPI002619375C|nr:hypothetical protein [uncultured Duncaniella sp.]